MFRRFMASSSMADLSFEHEIPTMASAAMASCSNNNELCGVAVANARTMEWSVRTRRQNALASVSLICYSQGLAGTRAALGNPLC